MSDRPMAEVGKWFIVMGLIVAAAGLAIWGLGRIGYRGLPGDISYEGEHVRIYFPIVTCLVLSALLTAIFWIWQWFSRG